MTTQNGRDRLDDLQYRIFRAVLFIIFLGAMYQLLDSHVHVTQFVSGMLGK
jgi:hypothetical protein